ncbi:MAG: sigma-54-dependent Fis family transcriptional regulator [Candidatus Eisenbacteria sp.]|nr:sigma-54-dependent Fis family transcriptional regulator [Candidatus Eisenbacteria bacterium]
MVREKNANILVVDDAEDVLSVISDLLRLNGYRVTEASSGEAALTELSRGHFDVVLTDLEMPVVSGMNVLAAARRQDPEMPVVMVTAYSTIERAVQAMREGAFDFIPKPVRSEDLLGVVERARDRSASAEEMSGSGLRKGFRGEPFCVCVSPAMRRVMEEVDRVASSDATVLLLGESGTGKEMVSRTIHTRSPRHEAPLVVINCAAIPGELMENELFGSERGAFTGAAQRKQGKFEMAEGGTIVLDEIGELNLSLQAKLLRVLEEKEFERLGGTKTIPLDVRVIAASNRDLEVEVENGQFRVDLFYRLNVFPIELPPLRDRKEDIPDLARHFVAEMARELRKPVETISDESMQILQSHDWPGNVRELRNVVERSVILCDGSVLQPSHVIIPERQHPRGKPAFLEEGSSLKDVSRRASSEAEIEMIRQVMEEVRWNRRKAARRLGVSYKTLWNKLKEYHLG